MSSSSTVVNSQGNDRASPGTYDEYHESSPTVKNWLKSKMNNPQQRIKTYFLSFFPFLTWIYRYNFVWFWGDLIAGVTVGVIVIPQGMAYAGLARLAPQFGLYSSFVGVMIYWFFATSKVSIHTLDVALFEYLSPSIGYKHWTSSCSIGTNWKYS